MKHLTSAIAVIGLFLGAGAHAAPVNGSGFLKSEVIFGSGNADGSWTGATGGEIEVALRGKLRFDALGFPQNVFNYDGDRTYTFDPSLSMVPTNMSVFNFEFSVNSDINGATRRNVNDIDWNLTIDIDPTGGVVNVFDGDMINTPLLIDHSFGNNLTANGAGVVATDEDDYELFRFSNNVAQNSGNLGFVFSPDPDAPGIYTFTLSGSNSTGVLASTSIDIVVAAAVPLPASLPLLLGSIGLMGLVRRRRKT